MTLIVEKIQVWRDKICKHQFHNRKNLVIQLKLKKN